MNKTLRFFPWLRKRSPPSAPQDQDVNVAAVEVEQVIREKRLPPECCYLCPAYDTETNLFLITDARGEPVYLEATNSISDRDYWIRSDQAFIRPPFRQQKCCRHGEQFEADNVGSYFAPAYPGWHLCENCAEALRANCRQEHPQHRYLWLTADGPAAPASSS